MDAIEKRREHLGWEARFKAEKDRIEFMQKMKSETIKSHIVSLRISLQEYLLDREDLINQEITDLLQDEEKLKKFDKE